MQTSFAYGLRHQKLTERKRWQFTTCPSNPSAVQMVAVSPQQQLTEPLPKSATSAQVNYTITRANKVLFPSPSLPPSLRQNGAKTALKFGMPQNWQKPEKMPPSPANLKLPYPQSSTPHKGNNWHMNSPKNWSPNMAALPTWPYTNQAKRATNATTMPTSY